MGPVEFVRRHTLWAGFLAVLVPLAVLLVLQFVWLSRLARVSAVAHEALLENDLEAVASRVELHYRTAAERLLNLPAALFTSGQPDRAADFWTKRPVAGVRRLFLVDFTRTEYGNFYVYDPATSTLAPAAASDESMAVIVASMPWQIAASRGGRIDAPALTVDERDPAHRIILSPVGDEGSRLVGIAGMILDEDWFRRTLLPQAIADVLPENSGVTVTDGAGRLLLRTGEDPVQEDRRVAARSGLSFVFREWSLALDAPLSAPERWARAGRVSNMAVAVLLAAVLTGGVALAFRAAGRAVRLSEMKSDFVSNVSHELRTPLASIRVFAEFLRTGRAGPDKAREYGERIEQEATRLSRLIDNILDFSRIESGEKSYRMGPVDLASVASTAVATFRARLEGSGFEVDFRGGPGDALPVTADPDALGQVLHNLLDNAVKYSGDSRTVEVRVGRQGDDAVLSVRDHGVGIPRAEVGKIFDRFHRVGTGSVHDVKGSGLGLAIVRHVVQAHGGTIDVDSAPGRGSTFTIRLPSAPAPRPAQA